MTLRLTSGGKRRNQRGQSLLELLGVIVLVGIMAASAGYYIVDAKRKDQLRGERASQRLIAKIDEARSQAKAGSAEFEKRSVNLGRFDPGNQVEMLREIEPGVLPQGETLLDPAIVLEFEQQSGRTINRVHGAIVFRDMVTGKQVAVRVGYPYSPTARYVRQPGAARFEITSNAIR